MTEIPAEIEISSEPAVSDPPEIIFDPETRALRILGRGHVYRFVPTRELAGGNNVVAPIVPYGRDWPPYLVHILALYLPLPEATSKVPYFNEPIPGESHPRLDTQLREDREPAQATYNHWPLYFCALDDAHQSNNSLPGLFEPVYISLTPLRVPPDDQFPYPPRISGP